MQLILRVTGGPAAGRKFLLRQGQIAKVGRTEWTDFGLPQDAALDEYHFLVSCQTSGCGVADLEGESDTLLNGTPIPQSPLSPLRHGDQIQAGESTFTGPGHR